MRKKLCLLALVLLMIMLSGCMAPKGKTIILNEPDESENNVPVLSSDFEVKRVVPVAMDKIDPDGLHPDARRALCGWKDSERLLVMSVSKSTLPQDALPEGTVEQQTERTLTQFATLNYQYGFFDPLFALTDVRVDCGEVSPDGKYVACIAGNTLSVYSLSGGSLLSSVSRDVYAPRVTFSKDGTTVYFTSAGETKRLEALDVLTGQVRTVQDAKSYRVLCGDKDNLLLTVVSQGTEEISFLSGGTMRAALLTGKKSGNACLLSDGSALLVYGDGLFRISGSSGAVLLQSGITAFAYDEESKYIAYALRSTDGSIDVCLGSFDQGTLEKGNLAYKDNEIGISTLCWGTDLRRLYVQGADKQNVQRSYVIEFD